MDARYADAFDAARSVGIEAKLVAYEAAAAKSDAISNRTFAEVQRLAFSDDEVFATYYQRIKGGLHLPGGDDWDALRAMADTAIFGDAGKEHVRFAALSITGCGLTNYGECSLVWREDMIAHRASVFEENTAVFYQRHGIAGSKTAGVPPGYRATWSERGKLAAIKASGTPAALASTGFADLLLAPASGRSGDDQFVEAHIWGPLTARSLQTVRVQAWNPDLPPSDVAVRTIEAKLSLRMARFDHP